MTQWTQTNSQKQSRNSRFANYLFILQKWCYYWSIFHHFSYFRWIFHRGIKSWNSMSVYHEKLQYEKHELHMVISVGHQDTKTEVWHDSFHIYLMQGIQTYAGNWNSMMAVWATSKIGQLIKPIWQDFFALSCSSIKKLSSYFDFFPNFWVLSPGRYQNCCQISGKRFWFSSTW